MYHEALFLAHHPPLTEEDIRRIGHRVAARRRARAERRDRRRRWWPRRGHGPHAYDRAA
ncbi:hypothetical protein [Nocardiopsis protaetiae]|uniref:hypothetical protein n=1 Tax=Nocardiopsis protaetiae TaxID=3382270 RepID=UPI00387AC89D